MNELSFKTKFLNGLRLLFRNRIGEALLYPLTKGKNWNRSISKVPANFYQYPKGSFRKVNRNGFEMELDLSEYMQWLIYFGILAEPRETLYGLIKPGMTILDVGANIGETTMEFSKRTGQNGKVISFEPHPDTFIRLKNHLHINHCGNVTPVNKGLGESDNEMILEEGEHNSGGNRISPDQSLKGKKIIITSLDKSIVDLGLNKIDFIKIDVEGYEYQVLSGALETIKKSKPTFFIEVVNDFLLAQGTSSQKLIRLLEEQHYSIKNANDGSAVNSSMNFSGTHFDIIATPA